MTETPYYFANGRYRLFGVAHDAPGRPTGIPFVFCHPFAEEKLWTHRVFVHYARRLAAAGHPVLRFDFMGNGDSEGEFSESTLETMCADVRCAVDQLRQRAGAGPVALLGLRLGATIASLVAEDAPDIGPLVLWAPVTNGDRYIQEMLRINVTTQMAAFKEVRHDRVELVAQLREGRTVNLDGYEMALPLFEGVSGIRLGGERKRHPEPCLVVQIDRQPGRPAPDLQELTSLYDRATLVFAQEEPFWKEIPRSYQRPADSLFDVTSDWLLSEPVLGSTRVRD